MTNKEAIEVLKPLFEQCKGTDTCLGYIEHFFSKDEETALDLAIKALEERPHEGDLISREALKKAFEDTVCVEPMPYAFVKQIIDNAPTAVDLPELKEAYQDGYKDGQNDRPQGKWTHWGSPFSDDNVANSIVCSVCGARFLEVEGEVFNFCPNCGADMRKGGTEE